MCQNSIKKCKLLNLKEKIRMVILKYLNITLFLSLLFVGNIQAAGKYKFSKIKYVVKQVQSIDEVYNNLLKDKTSSKLKKYLVRKTKQINQKVSGWDELRVGQKFKLVIEKRAIDRKKYASYKAQREKSNFAFGVFVAASAGSFKQSNSTNDEITFSQNSPVTIGVNSSFKMSTKIHLSASAYSSYFLPADNKYSSSEVSLPLEFGTITHLGYKFTENQYLFTGVDFERLSIFNSTSIAKENEVVVDQINLAYLVFAYQYDLKNKYARINTKISGAYSVFSQVDYAKSVYDDNQSFSGYKLMLSSFISFDSPWYYIMFFKYHDIKDDSEINFTQYGAGIGYWF